MNVSAGLFRNTTGVRLRRCVALCLGTAVLTGCASVNPFATAPVDPQSPAAKAVLEAARADRAYPKFSDIPPAPTDVRPPRAWAAAVGAPANTEAFARDARERATPPPSSR